jgi:hypothetical protein
MRKDSSASKVLEFQRLGDKSKFAGISPDTQGSLHIEIKRNSFRSVPPPVLGTPDYSPISGNRSDDQRSFAVWLLRSPKLGTAEI